MEPFIEGLENLITLKPMGDSYVGLCPFHKESTPSLRITREGYHCLSCGKKGTRAELQEELRTRSENEFKEELEKERVVLALERIAAALERLSGVVTVDVDGCDSFDVHIVGGSLDT